MAKIFYKRKLFWIVFGVPNILSLFYFLLIASPQYVSETSLVVYQAEQNGGAAINLQLSQNGGGLSLEGNYLLQSYLGSWDCFSHQDRAELEKAWGSGDFVSRFGGLLDAFRRTPTLLWRYYRHHVTASIDEQSAIMTLRVTGYDADFVKKLADSVLASGGHAINIINQQAFANAEEFFSGEISKDRAKLRADIDQLSTFQKKTRVVDPTTAYSAQLDLLNQLTGKLVALSAQVDMINASTPNSIQVSNLASERRSLEQRIGELQQKVYGQSGAITQVVGEYRKR